MQYLITYMSSNSIVIEADSEDAARDAFWDMENFRYACEALNDAPVDITDVEEYEE